MGGRDYPDAGTLRERVEVLELRPIAGGYEWQRARNTWARCELSTRNNIWSVHGIGAAGAVFTLRRQSLSLDNALRWQGRHCFITGIVPLGPNHIRVETALVVVSACADRYTETTFPAILTEKYLGHRQLEPQAVNVLRHVLVTPGCIRLTPGKVVEVDGEKWPIQVAHLLDPHKNEYELERTVDL